MSFSGVDHKAIRPAWFLVPALLAIAAFIPILDNGFIADDFVNLQRAESLKANPLYLFGIPPENFRTTLYVVFAVLKTVAGYSPAIFYAFNILAHAANVLLLGYLVWLLTEDFRIALCASSFMAVFAAPQEAVMWLAGMPETLLLFFILLTLILWMKDQPVLAAFAYAGALLSKESSVIVLALIPALDLYRGKALFRRAYLCILIPTALFALSFALTWSVNTSLSSGAYQLSSRTFGVLGRSLHRLLWPWFYIVLIVARLAGGVWPRRRMIALSIAGVLLLLLPYMTVAYAPSLPSRNAYLASAALMGVFGILIGRLWDRPLARVFIAVFILFNVAYLWIRKDRQFEERAAPTTALLHALEGRSPQKTLILDFGYPYPEIAQASVLLLPGWTRESVVVAKSRDACPECQVLRWNAGQQVYEASGAQDVDGPSQ